MRYDGRTIVIARAWLMQTGDTESSRAAASAIPGPDEMPGGTPPRCGHRRLHRVGRGAPPGNRPRPGVLLRARHSHPGLDGEQVSKLASAATLFDIANGMAVRVDPPRWPTPTSI